jgi:hypothetical protein
VAGQRIHPTENSSSLVMYWVRQRESEQPVQDYHIPVTRNACSYACRAVWLCSPFSSSDFAEIYSLIVGSAGDDDNRLACAGPVATLKRRSDVEAAGAPQDRSTEFEKSMPLMNIASSRIWGENQTTEILNDCKARWHDQLFRPPARMTTVMMFTALVESLRPCEAQPNLVKLQTYSVQTGNVAWSGNV